MNEQKNIDAEIERYARAFCGSELTCSDCVNRNSNIYFTKKEDCSHFIFAKNAIEKNIFKIELIEAEKTNPKGRVKEELSQLEERL